MPVPFWLLVDSRYPIFHAAGESRSIATRHLADINGDVETPAVYTLLTTLGWLGTFRNRLTEIGMKLNIIEQTPEAPSIERQAIEQDLRTALNNALNNATFENPGDDPFVDELLELQEELWAVLETAQAQPLDRIPEIFAALQTYDENVCEAFVPVVEDLHERQAPFLETVAGFSLSPEPLEYESLETLARLMVDRALCGWTGFGPSISTSWAHLETDDVWFHRLQMLREEAEDVLPRTVREIDTTSHITNVYGLLETATLLHSIKHQLEPAPSSANHRSRWQVDQKRSSLNLLRFRELT